MSPLLLSQHDLAIGSSGVPIPATSTPAWRARAHAWIADYLRDYGIADERRVEVESRRLVELATRRFAATGSAYRASLFQRFTVHVAAEQVAEWSRSARDQEKPIVPPSRRRTMPAQPLPPHSRWLRPRHWWTAMTRPRPRANASPLANAS